MIFRIFSFLFLTIPFFADGQLSLKNPSICHDKEDYLKCYNDGTYILKFEKGNFIEFKTTDSTVRYSNLEKTITIYKKLSGNDTEIDSLQIKLLPRSVILKKGNLVSEVKSFTENINLEIYKFMIDKHSRYNSSIYEDGNNLSFNVNDIHFNIRVDVFNQSWSWNIFMQKNKENLSVRYNGYQQNRLAGIDIEDDSFQYGIWVLVNELKSKNKIWVLESFNVDSAGRFHIVGYGDNMKAIIGGIPLNKMYKYDYYKNGKLNRKKSIGEIKLCD